MTRLIFSFFVIGTLMVFFGCSSDNVLDTERSEDNQVSTSLAKRVKAKFTGTCNFVAPIAPGTTTVLPNGKTLIEGMVAEWYDEASDPRVTGKTIWYANQLLDEDGNGRYWGTTELIVDNDGGKWKMEWGGNLTNGGTVGIAKVFGTGIEGDVTGLTAKWIYKIDVSVGFFYKTEGFIIEK